MIYVNGLVLYRNSTLARVLHLLKFRSTTGASLRLRRSRRRRSSRHPADAMVLFRLCPKNTGPTCVSAVSALSATVDSLQGSGEGGLPFAAERYGRGRASSCHTLSYWHSLCECGRQHWKPPAEDDDKSQLLAGQARGRRVDA
jgi:hypothetical protein